MGTKKLEKIALGVMVVLCVAVVVLLVRSNQDAPPSVTLPPQEEPVSTPEAAAPAAPETGNADSAAPPPEESASASIASGAPAPAAPTPSTPAPASPAPQEAVEQISAEDAKAIALTHAGLTAEEVTFTQQKLEWEDGRQVYDVEFYSPSAAYDSATRTEYDYEIDAVTGEIVKFDQDAESYSSPAPADPSGIIITQEAARETALGKVPGATADNVTKLKLDQDDGRQIYEVEIIYNGMEYDLEIDATAGTVLEFDAESIYD